MVISYDVSFLKSCKEVPNKGHANLYYKNLSLNIGVLSPDVVEMKWKS